MDCSLLKQELIIEGLYLIKPKLFADKRGSFAELYNKKDYRLCGLDDEFIQDNISVSEQGVLRGVHTQLMYPQAKIVSCLSGRIFDVVVDCRPQSSSFRKWYGVELSEENRQQLYLPAGVAHGFYTIERAIVYMKVTTHYTPGDEIGFMWNDESIGIEWPTMKKEPLLAPKDNNWGTFNEMMQVLKKRQR